MVRFAVITSLIAGCASNGSPTGIDSTSLTCPPDSMLTYDNFGESVIAVNCQSCHATQRPHLGTLADIQANTDAIINASVLTTKMPKGNSNMVLEERQMLGEWLTCGAP